MEVQSVHLYIEPYFCYCRTAVEWVNPAQYGLIVVTSSEGRNLPYGKLEDIVSRDSAALNCHTNDDKLVEENLYLK